MYMFYRKHRRKLLKVELGDLALDLHHLWLLLPRLRCLELKMHLFLLMLQRQRPRRRKNLALAQPVLLQLEVMLLQVEERHLHQVMTIRRCRLRHCLKT